RTAVEQGADVVGLSGLITPSLDEMVHVAEEMTRLGLDLPLLIGGATTSREHTSVKIAPAYRASTVHVLDASRAVGVVASLLDARQRPEFDRRNREEQARIREVHALKAARPLVPLATADAGALRLAWRREDAAPPRFVGRRVLDDVPLATLLPYVDWRFFFTAWELPGRFPEVLEDPKYGEAARDLYENGRRLLDRIVRERLRFPMLRQQGEKAKGTPYLALSDFVAPVESGVPDWIGAFAVTAGLGVDALVAGFEAAHDDYSAILAKALADRLAEAGAEWLHERARREWYAADERLGPDALLKEKYRGIRPAFGYPACPDHTEKAKLFALLDAPAAGSTLTEHFAMLPAASVSGIYLAHPAARYFAVGRIGRDQVEAYARRKGATVAEVEKWLAPNLGYDPKSAAAAA